MEGRRFSSWLSLPKANNDDDTKAYTTTTALAAHSLTTTIVMKKNPTIVVAAVACSTAGAAGSGTAASSAVNPVSACVHRHGSYQCLTTDAAKSVIHRYPVASLKSSSTSPSSSQWSSSSRSLERHFIVTQSESQSDPVPYRQKIQQPCGLTKNIVLDIPRCGGVDRTVDDDDQNSDQNNNDDDDVKNSKDSSPPPSSSSPTSSSPKPDKRKKKKKSSNKHRSDNSSSTSTSTDLKGEGDDDNVGAQHSSSSSQPKTDKIRPDVKTVMDEILQHTDDYYQILGVSTTATDKQIQKAYRKRVQKCHPDKTNGDRRAFDLVAEAYDVLSDETKRATYDRFGKDGLDPTGQAGGVPTSYHDLFSQMFRQAQHQRRQPRRNPTLRYQLEVQLEDLYHGCTQSATVSPPYNPLQMRSSSSPSSRGRKTVDVHIPKGSVSGQSIVLSGEADFNQETTPGDIIFILTQAPHKTFTRKGHDLAMELTIGLDEAICGFQRPIHHLDGTEIWIESAHNTKHVYSTDDGKGTSRDSVSQSISSPLIIQTGEVQVLKGRGMPKRHQPGEFGDLYIQYRVEMPGAKSADVLTETEKAELSRLLTKLQGTKKQHHHHRRRRKADEDDGGKGPIHTLQAAKAEDFGRSSGKVVLDDDDNSSHSGLHDDHGDEFHPFASGASSFFHSGGTGGTSRFYFGHNSNAFGIGGNQDDDGNVQCQQM